jgi:hypothetical protein
MKDSSDKLKDNPGNFRRIDNKELDTGRKTTNAQHAVWQYGGATNIFSTFYSLIGL